MVEVINMFQESTGMVKYSFVITLIKLYHQEIWVIGLSNRIILGSAEFGTVVFVTSIQVSANVISWHIKLLIQGLQKY